jgi:hypothetical protein
VLASWHTGAFHLPGISAAIPSLARALGPRLGLAIEGAAATLASDLPNGTSFARRSGSPEKARRPLPSARSPGPAARVCSQAARCCGPGSFGTSGAVIVPSTKETTRAPAYLPERVAAR